MARDTNNVNVIGRLVRDVEVKYSSGGVAIGKLSIANNDSVKKDNKWQDEVSFFDVVVFGNQAVNAEKFLKKGSQVAIEGRIKQQRWIDQATQQNRSKIEILANGIQFLSPVQGAQDATNNVPNNPYQNQNDESIPF